MEQGLTRPTQLRPNWFRRNWKWFVPAAVVLLVIEAAVFVWLVMAFMKTQGPYQEALERARGSAEVIDALGTPIEDGLFTTGNVRVSGSFGGAVLNIPIHGPKARATIRVIAIRRNKEWEFTLLVVEVAGSGAKIDLLKATPSETVMFDSVDPLSCPAVPGMFVSLRRSDEKVAAG